MQESFHGGSMSALVHADGWNIAIKWSQESYGPAKFALIVGVILVMLAAWQLGHGSYNLCMHSH